MPLTTRSGRNPSQNEFELRSFIDLLRAREVGRYLEIGARHGDTFHEVMLSLPVGSVGVALDLPGGLWGTHKSRSHLQEAVHDLRQRGYHASVIFGDSKARNTKALVESRGPYDAVLIDGDHTLAGVTADWNAYGGLAKMVAFHDIVGADCVEKVRGNAVEVPVLWAELKASLTTCEFVDTDSKMGIGVVLRS